MTRGMVRFTAVTPWFSRTIVSTLVMPVAVPVEGEEGAVDDCDTDGAIGDGVALGAPVGVGAPHAASPISAATAGVSRRDAPRIVFVDHDGGRRRPGAVLPAAGVRAASRSMGCAVLVPRPLSGSRSPYAGDRGEAGGAGDVPEARVGGNWRDVVHYLRRLHNSFTNDSYELAVRIRWESRS